MKLNWLYTTAIALVIGAGAAIAQAPDAAQKREGTRAQSPAAQSKEADRPAAGERMKERAGQAEQKGGAREMQRGERPAAGERSKQAQEPKGRAGKEQTRQSQDQGREQGRDQDRRDRPGAGTAQKDEQKGGAAKQATEDKARGRDDAKQDRAQDTRQDTKQPADAKQQSRQQTDRDRRDQKDQAAQPSGTSTQQTGRPTEGTQDQQRTGQAADRSDRRTTSVNEDQRKQIVNDLRRDRSARTNINVRVNVGERLPPRVQPRRLPPDIVRIAPQYRGYEYTVIEDRVVIVDPRRREVIDILDDEPGYGVAGYGRERERIVFTGEQRARWKELARSSSATVGSTAPSGSATSSSDGAMASNCLSLQPVPEEMVRDRPELSNYRYLAVGDEIILVDPQQRKIVQVIESQ
jgi:Protein of unknown function (DUF1236)